MNMTDIRKMTRGVTLWREDVLKYRAESHGGRSLSEFLRDLLHSRMERLELSPADKKELDRQLAMAKEARKAKLKRKPADTPTRLGRRLAFSEAISIPAKVRKSPIFVKGK